jgi:hypothetical protein
MTSPPKAAAGCIRRLIGPDADLGLMILTRWTMYSLFDLMQ